MTVGPTRLAASAYWACMHRLRQPNLTQVDRNTLRETLLILGTHGTTRVRQIVARRLGIVMRDEG